MGPFPGVWARGNLRILEQPLLGFFCSVQCPGRVIVCVYDAVRVLRDAGVAVAGGFQSPLEKDGLDFLLRGRQPVVVCPARSIDGLRLPAAWRAALDDGRLLILSPFAARHRRATGALAEARNRFVADLADEVLIAYAAEGGRMAALCARLLAQGRRVRTFAVPENQRLVAQGAIATAVADLAALAASG